MAQHIEPLSGGLVTSRDASLLAEGELQQCDDCMYRPNDTALHRALGRIRLNSTAMSAVTGLRYCAFDSPDPDVLVAQTSTAYLRGPITGGSTVFTSLGTITGGTSFDSVHYRNRHYLLNGSNDNKVLLKDGTLRAHGMKPVTGSPSVTVTTSGGVWPLGASSVPNYYEYWTTEVYKTATEDIESTFTGTPATVYISDVNDYAVINRPPEINSAVTHWRVYRSISKSIPLGQAFPAGFLIGELGIDSASFSDGLAIIGSKLFPSTSSASARTLKENYETITDWTNRPNLLADDAAYATGDSFLDISTTAGGAIKFISAKTTIEGELGGLAFSGLGDPIADISVEIQGYHNRLDGRVAIALSHDGGVTWTANQSTYLGINAGSPVTAIIPGLWGRVWSAGEFSSSLFRIRLSAYNTQEGAAVTHTVDYVAVTVTHSGTTASQAVSFPALQVTVGTTTLSLGRDGPPPKAFMGDIFEEGLVVNDVANPTQIAYSTQEDPDSFPSAYILSFQTKDKDTVRCLKTLGNVLMVGLYSKLFRVNYLPRENDAEFDRGRAIDLISADHGIVGPRAACVFQMDGQPLMMAYVSRYGLHMTDGYKATTLTDDIDWSQVAITDNCELMNDPSNYHIVLFLATKKYHLSYHPTHLKNGKLKVSGPDGFACAASTSASLDSGATGFYTGRSDGFVYVENSGASDGSGGTISPVIRTRDLYLAGQGNEWQITKALLHHGVGVGITLNGSLRVEKTNATGRDTPEHTIEGLTRGMTRIPLNDMGEGISVKIRVTGDDSARFNYLVVEGEGFGTEDSLA